MENNGRIGLQIYTCHDSWAVVACVELWPDWVMSIEIRIKRMFTNFKFWTHDLFAKWVPIVSDFHDNGVAKD